MPNSGSMEFYVALDGEDRGSWEMPDPNSGTADAPFATIAGARDAVRDMKERGLLSGPVTVFLRGGRHEIDTPVVFRPEDSGPITYAAYPGERPVISGGRQITGWTVEERDGRTVWTTTIPEVAAGEWYFKQLFVDGERRARPRLPREGFYRIEDVPGASRDDYIFTPSDHFVAAAGDIGDWSNITDVEAVVLHFWVEERMPFASYDEATRLVTSSRATRMNLKDEVEGWAKYYVENVREALGEPGDWYLDRHAGELTYVPMPGESPDGAVVVAPVADELLRFEGRPDEGEFVEHLRFVGIGFEHTTWDRPPDGLATYSQAANGVGGAVRMEGARYCAIEDCIISHLGGYGIEIADGCTANRIVGNEVVDIGGGGVKLNGSVYDGPAARRTGNNRITDNHIARVGRVFHSAIGILSMHSFGNTISHNRIHDLYYTGISCGWVWGYANNISQNNTIEKNYIHDVGQGWLSDMGGIYMLGVQPGTVLRGNVVHDVRMWAYGGWAIYTDEGSSHMIIENNVGYRTSGQAFHQHYGRENTIRNNIWAFGEESNMRCTRIEPHLSLTFERNIVITDGQPIYQVAAAEHPHFHADLNLFWDVNGKDIALVSEHSNDEWHGMGNDLNSVVADPKCADAPNGDFALADDSPALALGFRPFDVSDVGPRPADKRD